MSCQCHRCAKATARRSSQPRIYETGRSAMTIVPLLAFTKTGPKSLPVMRMLRGAIQIPRVEELPLQRGAEPVHDARANLAVTRELVGHRLQKPVTLMAGERPGSRHHGLQLDVAEANWRRH